MYCLTSIISFGPTCELALNMLDLAPIHEHHHHPHTYHSQGVKDCQSVYLRQQQPYQLAVIELVEVAPPTPRRLSSVIDSSSYFSSSAGSEDDEADDDDEEEEVESETEMDEDQDPEVNGALEDMESYCSSDLDKDGDQPSSPLAGRIPRNDSFQRCVKRILLWRERSGDATKCPFPEIDTSTSNFVVVDESHDSKRSRHSSSSSISSLASFWSSTPFAPEPSDASSASLLAQRRFSNTSSITSAELEMHSCPACDAFFPTLAGLREHGKATGNEACCAAVEYAFEK